MIPVPATTVEFSEVGFPTSTATRLLLGFSPLKLRIKTIWPDGETVLRPDDLAAVDARWPWKTVVFKGKEALVREGCPFMPVTKEMAESKKNDRFYKEGDLLANAAWSLWEKFRPASGS